MPGVRCARSLACSVKNTRVSHHGHTGITRHSPRNGFNGFLRALPGDRACLSPSSAVSRRLDAGVEASGPHDFAVRVSAARLRFLEPEPNSAPGAAASTASRPASVTIASRPSEGRDGEGYIADLGPAASKISEIQKLSGVPFSSVTAGAVRPFRKNVSSLGVMPGLVPDIHVFLHDAPQERRGWPGQARP